MADDLLDDRPYGRPADEVPGDPMVTSLSANPPARMHPGDIARHAFSTARRGFDPEEVRSFLERVAQQLEFADRREQELLHELTGAEDRARHPIIDEAVLTSALGQRSAGILRAAHEEASRIVQKSEEAAAALQREAQHHATDVQVNAESSAAERVAEAELEANALRQQAREESAALIEAARAEGEGLLERAREHGRAMLDQAQDARRKVLTDMAQRRRLVTDQIEQFRAARDEIAGSVIGVRRALDRIVEDLSRADDAARAAASGASRLHRSDVSDDALVDEAERAAAEVGADSGAGLAALARTADTLVHSSMAGSGGTAIGDWRQDTGVLAETTVSTPIGELPGYGEAPPGAGSGSAPRVTLRFDDIASVVETPGVEDRFPADVSSSATAGGEPAVAGLDTVSADADESVRVVRRGPDDVAASTASVTPTTPSTDVDDLFARLRARGDLEAPRDAAPTGTGATGSEAGVGDPAGSGPAGDGTTAGEAHPAGDGTLATRDPSDPVAAAEDGGSAPEGQRAAEDDQHKAPSPDGEALARRAEVLGPVVATLSRKLKRALQDDQNRLLDRLRKGTGEWSDELLADEEAQRELYVQAAAAPVRDLVAAGIAFARSQVKGRHGRAPAPDHRTVDSITHDLSGSVVTLLRRRLEEGEIPDAAERIGAAYREWRGERIERLAEDAAVDAFDAGVLAGSSKSAGVRWVRNDEGPGCADCEDNALAGTVRPGEEFPTGHHHPPAHAGCRCLLVPTPA